MWRRLVEDGHIGIHHSFRCLVDWVFRSQHSRLSHLHVPIGPMNRQRKVIPHYCQRGMPRDDQPSPPRAKGGASVMSLDSLLSLAKKNESKFSSGFSEGSVAVNGPEGKSKTTAHQQNGRKKHPREDNGADPERDTQGNSKKRLGKRQRVKRAMELAKGSGDVHATAVASENTEEGDSDNDEASKDDYPYPVVGDDHCESPLEAYEDIRPLLDILARSLNKSSHELAIYDPYYCEGSMVARLGSLGFDNIYNRKEDFYTSIRLQSTPPHDVLLTNPPYSTDHMEKLLQFCVRNGQNTPFCLLVPNYVYTKDYFHRIILQAQTQTQGPTRSGPNMFFVTPKKRYLYTTPKGRRQQKSGKITSPFPTFWYCGNFKPEMLSQLQQWVKSAGPTCAFAVASSAQTIPLEIAPDNDPRKKKLRNNMKRKKNKDKKKAQ